MRRHRYEAEQIRELVASIVLQAVDDLAPDSPPCGRVTKSYQAALGKNRKNRESAIRFFGSAWGRYLMASCGILTMPQELERKILEAKVLDSFVKS